MARLAVVVLVLSLLGGCDPIPESGLKLATFESADAGLSLRELSPQALKSVRLPFGMAVVKAGGLAGRAGLKVGDVVYGINQKKVRTLAEFSEELKRGNGRVGFLVRRGATDFYVALDFAGGGPPAAPTPKETLLRT
jgi:S1-C subfamily serine protease